MQTFTSKSEALESLRLDSSVLTFALRSNIVWVIRKDSPHNILCILNLKKTDAGWLFDEEFETDELENLSCPIGYLEKTKSISEVWRSKVREANTYVSLAKQITKELRRIKENEELIIITTSKTIPELVLESASPFEGRFNGILYRIPKKKVKGYRICPKQ